MTRSRGRLGVWLLIGGALSGTWSLSGWAQDEVERYWSQAEQETRQARQAEQQQDPVTPQASPSIPAETSHEFSAGSITGTSPDAQAFQQTTTMNRGFLAAGASSMNQPMGGDVAAQGQDLFQPPGGGFGMPSLSSPSELRATEPSGSMPEQLNRLGVVDTSGQPLGLIGTQQGIGEIPGDAQSLLKTQQPSPLEMRGGGDSSGAASGSWTHQDVPSSQQGLLLNQQGSAGGSQMPSAGSAGQGMRQEGPGGSGAQGQSPSSLTPGIAVGAEVRQGGNAPSGGGSSGRRQ